MDLFYLKGADERFLTVQVKNFRVGAPKQIGRSLGLGFVPVLEFGQGWESIDKEGISGQFNNK